jgi:hypothetical protein
MKFDNVLLTIAVIAVGVSLVSTGVVYFSIANLATQLTGYVTTGTANLSIESSATVNFTTDDIDWGSGKVDDASTKANLNTFENNNVSGGNWTLVTSGGMRIENVGNTNVSINLSGTKTAANFIGGTSPVYEWNITNVEASSCLNDTGGTDLLNLDTFHNVNITVGDGYVCGVFQFKSSADTIRVDFNLTIPEDAPTGAKTDTITATVNAA